LSKTDWKTGKRFKQFQFDHAYAITCHKSQGSQWDNVFVLNERFYNAQLNQWGYHPEWLYTAITRASEKLILAL
jgi:exodeoxyribonuclease-5